MAELSGLAPAGDVMVSGIAKLASYASWLIPLVIVIALGFIFWWVSKIKDKKKQWTHNLKVRRVLQDGRVTDVLIHKMRRSPLEKRANLFELEKPLLGCYLIPELEEYSGLNEFSIILDKNNRIFLDKGTFFNPDKGYSQISARHAEIDIQLSRTKEKFQNINQINKRLEWSQIAKYGFGVIGVIAIMIIGIVAVQAWGEAQVSKAQQAQAEAQMMANLASVMESNEAVVNTQLLILPKLKDLYGTQNIQSAIKEIRGDEIS